MLILNLIDIATFIPIDIHEDIATLDSIEDTESIIRYMSTFIDRISEYI